jgi:hypothetical protein
MKNSKLLIGIMCIAFIFTACKKENNTEVQVLFHTSGKTAVGRSFTFNKFNVYLSDFYLLNAIGDTTYIKDVMLAKLNADNSFSTDVPKEIQKFGFSFGLSPQLNNSIPESFPASHPLSVEQDMYWGMLKYRFLVIDGGNVDTSYARNQTPVMPFSYHLGTDTLYRKLVFNRPVVDGDKVKIVLDIDKLFVLDSTRFNLNNFSNHSDPGQIPNAIKMVDAFISGISVQ